MNQTSFFTSPLEVNLPASTWLPQLPGKFPVLLVVSLLCFTSCTVVLVRSALAKGIQSFWAKNCSSGAQCAWSHSASRPTCTLKLGHDGPITKDYLMVVFRHTSLCTITTKKATIMTKNICLTCLIQRERISEVMVRFPNNWKSTLQVDAPQDVLSRYMGPSPFCLAGPEFCLKMAWSQTACKFGSSEFGCECKLILTLNRQ